MITNSTPLMGVLGEQWIELSLSFTYDAILVHLCKVKESLYYTPGAKSNEKSVSQ